MEKGKIAGIFILLKSTKKITPRQQRCYLGMTQPMSFFDTSPLTYQNLFNNSYYTFFRN